MNAGAGHVRLSEVLGRRLRRLDRAHAHARLVLQDAEAQRRLQRRGRGLGDAYLVERAKEEGGWR